MNIHEETKSRKVEVMLFSHRYRLYFIISDDFFLHFFNENMLHVAKLHLNTRLITHAVFLEKESRLIVGGIDGLTSFHVEVICKHDPT